MTEITVYSAVVCPFAHRSRLVLLEKGIDFNLVEIDLQNKPADFTEISPYGKVPAIKHGNERVWESAIINEYLDEVFPQVPLLPQNPIEKAQARIWIDFALRLGAVAYGGASAEDGFPVAGTWRRKAVIRAASLILGLFLPILIFYVHQTLKNKKLQHPNYIITCYS